MVAEIEGSEFFGCCLSPDPC